MPAFINIVRPPLPAAPLSRLLLECRYDFQNRIWNLPVSQAGPDGRLSFTNSQAALLPLLHAVISEFSDPSLGGDKRPKSATRRIGVRHSLRRSLGKTKTTKKRKNEN